MMDDQELLRSYAEEGCDAAFAQLVSRYVDLVHSAALRRVDGNLALARDIAQIVFTDLATKARRLPRNVVLGGWLHRATRFAAGHVLRAERRRKAREQEAALMNSIESESTPDWDKIRPMLDNALDTLSPIDRDALVLRFFEQHSLAKVGDFLGLSEDAARKRVSRALGKLRANLARKGATLTTATALATAISANAVEAAPAGMGVLLAKAVLSGATVKSGAICTLLKIISMTKLKLYGVSALIIAGVATPLIVQYRAQLKLREADAALQGQADQMRELAAANQQLSNTLEQLKTAPSLAPEQMRELLRLRGEVGQLRRQTNDLAKLAKERPASQAKQDEPTHPPEYFQQLHLMAAGKESDVKTLGLVFRLYASDHNDQFPTNYEALAPYFEKQKLSLTGTNDIDLFYQGSLAELGTNADQSQIIVFRDRQTWAGPDGKPTRVYGMADGSVQTMESEDNFQAWEAAHSFLQSNPSR